MMALKHLYKITSIFSIALGAFLVANSQKSILGYAITGKDIGMLPSLSWGAFFLITGIALLYFIIQSK